MNPRRPVSFPAGRIDGADSRGQFDLPLPARTRRSSPSGLIPASGHLQRLAQGLDAVVAAIGLDELVLHVEARARLIALPPFFILPGFVGGKEEKKSGRRRELARLADRCIASECPGKHGLARIFGIWSAMQVGLRSHLFRNRIPTKVRTTFFLSEQRGRLGQSPLSSGELALELADVLNRGGRSLPAVF